VASLDGVPHHERFRGGVLPAVDSRVSLARRHAGLVPFAEGRALAEEGLRIAEAVEHLASLILASCGVGRLALSQADLPRALPLLERAVGLCQDADLRAWFPSEAAALGEAYTLCGRVAGAVPLLMQALEPAAAIGRRDLQAPGRLRPGEAQLLAGRPEEAQSLAESTLALACEHQERGNEAYALRLLGEITAQREPPGREAAEANPGGPSPWPMNSVCARSRPTVTVASVPCTPGSAGGSKPAPNWLRLLTCTALWT
jgi:hypothetical protein